MAAVYRPSGFMLPSNYPPAYHYVLRVLADVFHEWTGRDLDWQVRSDAYYGRGTEDARAAALIYKLPAVLADAVLGALLVVWLGRRVRARTAFIVGGAYVLLPAVIHNSSVWGQVDAISTLFAVASLEAARRRKLPAMWAFATIAALTKAQVLVFTPIWILITVSGSRVQWKRGLLCLGVAVAISAIVVLPFRGELHGVKSAYTRAADFYPYVHLNGFSAWFLSNPIDRPNLSDLDRVYARDDLPFAFGVTPKTFGLVGLGIVAVLVILSMRRHGCDEASLFWAARTLPLAFFVFSTQMHERYAFPVLAVGAWAFLASRRWWVWWGILVVCVTANVLWSWAGPGDGAIVSGIERVLWSKWLGVKPGILFSLAFITTLGAALSGWIDNLGAFTRAPLRPASHSNQS